MSFDQLGLEPELLRAVADQGYTEPTPVQAQAIPLVLAGRDVLAGAQTGTGKTAAFVLPMLQRLHASRPAPAAPVAQDPQGFADRSRDLPARPGWPVRPVRRDPATRLPVRALILTPTRELALQVEESVRTYGARRPIRSTTIYGGVGFDPQVRALRVGPEIVVATPGRLLDHLNQRTVDLSHVEILVLDEADRMLDMGFIRDIRKILASIPARRQNLLFSATFSPDIRRLASDFLLDPAEVQVTPRNQAAELVSQLVHPVDRERKRELLSHLVRSGRIGQALVFTRTKHGATRLAEQLERDGIAAAAIHGNKSQSQRVRALDDFKAGRATVLVATDIAARGIDIDSLPHVVNFEMPMVAEDYIHRIGRTGRAGSEGVAVSLICVDEGKLLWEVESLLRRKIPSEVIEGFEPDRSIRPEPIRLRSEGSRPVMPGRQGGAVRPNPGRPTAGRPLARPNPIHMDPQVQPTPARPDVARPNAIRPNLVPNPRQWPAQPADGRQSGPGFVQPARAEQPGRPAQPGRPFQPGRGERPGSSERPGLAERSGFVERPGRRGLPLRPGQSIGGFAAPRRPEGRPGRMTGMRPDGRPTGRDHMPDSRGDSGRPEHRSADPRPWHASHAHERPGGSAQRQAPDPRQAPGFAGQRVPRRPGTLPGERFARPAHRPDDRP